MSGQPSIKLTITYVCQLLRDLGASPIGPEVFRQAKFNGETSQPLWLVIHDVIILHLCGWPKTHGGALTNLHQLTQQEQLTDNVQPEGEGSAFG